MESSLQTPNGAYLRLWPERLNTPKIVEFGRHAWNKKGRRATSEDGECRVSACSHITPVTMTFRLSATLRSTFQQATSNDENLP